MEPISGSPVRSSEQLIPGGAEEDRISALDDDLLLLVLARLGCVGAAARTGALARRWRGLWASLLHIVSRDVPLPSLEVALSRISRPPPGLSIFDIHVPDKKPRPDAAGVTSLLGAAALLEPKEIVFELPSRMVRSSPMFFLQLPADVKFPALQALSLSGCHVRFDSLLPWCPRLRVLRVKFNDHGNHEDIKTFMSIHSASLEEPFVEAMTVSVDAVDLVVPELKQLTVSLKAYREVNISISAPKVEELSWQWSYAFIQFGLWRIANLRLEIEEGQRELASLEIHARITSSTIHGEVEISTKEIEKHLIARVAVLDLYLKTKGHAFGAFVFHLLGMNPLITGTRRLGVFLQRSSFKRECPLDCACDHPDWRTQSVSLDALEEVEIYGIEGYDHEIDFLNLVFKCAPILKRMIVVLSHEVSSPDARCIEINNIFRAYLSVECYLYIAQVRLMHGSNYFSST
ncbi:unnamed protein product [Alopecurus aequalis]